MPESLNHEEDGGWALAPHVCAVCLGRVLSRSSGESEFLCSTCGATWTGEPKGGCACGIKVGSRDAGVRCLENPKQSPTAPWQYLAAATA